MSDDVYFLWKWYAGVNNKTHKGTYASEYDAIEAAIDYVSKINQVKNHNNIDNEKVEIIVTGQYRKRIFHPGCSDLWVEVVETVVQ